MKPGPAYSPLVLACLATQPPQVAMAYQAAMDPCNNTAPHDLLELAIAMARHRYEDLAILEIVHIGRFNQNQQAALIAYGWSLDPPPIWLFLLLEEETQLQQMAA